MAKATGPEEWNCLKREAKFWKILITKGRDF